MHRALLRPQTLVLAVLLTLVSSCENAPTLPPVVSLPLDTVVISATTTGAAFDADDYVVLVDGVEIEGRLEINGTASVAGEAGRTIELALTDVADNCEVDGAPRRNVTFVEGSVTSVSYAVHCVAPAGLEDARLVVATGSCDVPGMVAPDAVCDLHTVPLDGGEGRFLTAEGRSFQPAISADGSSIAFARRTSDFRTDVYAMDVDGENLRRITDDGDSWDPSWSPDGTRIVYVHGLLRSLIFPVFGQEPQIQIRRVDGEDMIALPTTDGALEPVWSPDGSRIAFSHGGGGSGNGIYTMAPDGREAALLAAGGIGPVWSPASDRLSYRMAGSVYVIGLNDEMGTLLLPGSHETTWTPTDWSPNGEWIAVTRRQGEDEDVYLLHLDGTMVRVTVDQQSSSAVFLPGTGGVAPPTEPSPLIVHGGVNAQNQNIWIFQGGLNISDGVSGAVVTVNGVSIPNVGDGLYPGYYSGKLPAAVPVGSPLHLRVSARGMIVEATSTVPEATVLTVPDSGAVFDPADPITVRWTSATDPDRFTIYVNTNHIVWEREVPGTARELVISGSELPEEVELVVAVVAYNDGLFGGPAHPDSRMGTMSSHGPMTVITIRP